MKRRIETIDPILRHPELLRSRAGEKFTGQGLESRKDEIDREDFARLRRIMGLSGARFKLYELSFDNTKIPILRCTPFKAYELAEELAQSPILTYDLPEKYKVGSFTHIHNELVDVELPKLEITDYDLICRGQGNVSQRMGLVQDLKTGDYHAIGEPSLFIGIYEELSGKIGREYLEELLERDSINGIEVEVKALSSRPLVIGSLIEAVVRSWQT
jgi:hypothetical protein